MNYRLIVRYDTTGEVTSQLYSSPFDVDMITSYLDRALGNGANLGYLVQERDLSTGEKPIIDYGGNPTGNLWKMPWD